MKRKSSLTLFSVCLGLCSLTPLQGATIYSTTFDQGYNHTYELAGQQGWVKDTTSSGGNGLITNFNGSTAAYVGLFDLQPPASWIYVWQPLNYTPVMGQTPVVNFSVVLSIIDSTTTDRDDFFWSVYNVQGDHLFTVDFDNKDLGIYYVLDGTNDWEYSGVTFTNDTTYTLQISLNFARNRWSAWLSNTNILSDLPITTTGAPLTLGDIDAVWAIYDEDYPGDNFMIFDNYQVVSEALVARPSLQVLNRAPNGDFSLRVSGQSGSRYAVEGSTNLVNWLPLQTNRISSVSFDYTDTGARALDRRFYRARQLP